MEIICRNWKYIFVGLFPAVFLYAVLVIYPIIRSFFYGFYEWNGLGQPVYIGLKNFQDILMDKVFWLSFKNNIFVVVASVVGQIPIGLLLAVILSRNLKGAGFFRSVFFIPMILSTVVVGLLWSTILNSQMGVLNYVLESAGLERFAQDWLGNPKIAMYTVCGVIVWQFLDSI